ncbi:rRNA-processing protein fcf1 [Sporothrix epigloea]|uniref:rRNA-processing protein fcf1 n=1 Tax=Sporothrix epigloea TaxID=1892477 RepID=A0ABP0DYP7_9PEZI
MGVAKKTRKFGQVKRLIGQSDARLKKNKDKAEIGTKKAEAEAASELIRSVPQMSISLFHKANTALVPPYQVLIDTNFLSHTVQRKLPLLETMMDCLYATCRPIMTDCVMAELEKLGPKYRIALKIARDERWERSKCTHKGCAYTSIFKRSTLPMLNELTVSSTVFMPMIYIVATNDRDLKRRIRKVPGVPIMSVARGKYVIENLPGAPVS